MSTSFQLPDLGEGVHEAEILAVMVKKGQKVDEGDILLEVETDKAVVEIPSPFTSVIATIHVQVGDIAKVGDILITFDAKSADDPGGDKSASTKKENTRQPSEAPTSHDPERPVPASPSTRRLARELQVDLHQVNGTGAKGRVTAEDVRRHAEKEQQPDIEPETTIKAPDKEYSHSLEPLPDFSQFGEIERKPFRSIRRATALRMSTSWSQIPHVNCQDVVDITKLEQFRLRYKEEIENAGGRLTMTVFALKAVATALKKYDQFNTSLDLESQEIIHKKFFNIGVAADTDQGLMVPVIRDVDRKSIKEISVELHQVLQRARERKCSREELTGGTFTITNAGAIGGAHFSAIINHPEVAILGLGQGRLQPAVVKDQRGNDKIEARLLMPIVLCFDHRVADGADAIRFLQVIINALQDPDELLITMT